METKSSQVWSKIYEEYESLSKKLKLIIITEEVLMDGNKNISLVNVSKISVGALRILYRVLSITSASIKHKKKYDLVFIRILDYPYMFTGIILKKIFKKKLVVWISNTETSYAGIKNKIYKSLYKKTLILADAIVTPSTLIIDDIQNYIGTINKSKIVVIKNEINLSRFKPLNINKNKNEILYVGRISRIKKIEEIVLALPLVMESISDVKLKIIGDIEQTSYFNDLKSLIAKLHCEKNVEFVGPIPHDKLVPYYNSANVFVLMSKSETESQVTHEAMACELPVVVTPVGLLPELIKDGENGFFVKPNHPKLLADRIIPLLQSKVLREKIGKAARKAIIESTEDGSFIKELNSVFSDVFLGNPNKKLSG